ncbi:tetratricopeptide repeat protein [Motiliproteus sediminis]|uniref:tetratricopeptide repeat protein n=1 Tax=Motiliproteus sediminis TaxID=1468178 RepID=UPI001AF00C48|nr:tetratricopeptide repeat protein [Motiliproteus sediminis]
MRTKLGFRRSVALLSVVSAILVAGYLIKLLPGDWSLTTEQKGVVGAVHVQPQREIEPVEFDRDGWRLLPPAESAAGDVSAHVDAQLREQTRILFEHGLALLQQGRYPEAVRALEMVITVAPAMPEAFVNLGFALYELNEFDAARGAFLRAMDLNPAQGNAYYGAAISYEALGDLEAALGTMRTFLHVTEGYETFKARARAAIWEWEARLGRVESAPPGGVESASQSTLQ